MYGFQYFYYFITCLSTVYPDSGVEVFYEVFQFFFQGHLFLVGDNLVRRLYLDGKPVLEIASFIIEMDFLFARGVIEGEHAFTAYHHQQLLLVGM